MKQAPKTLTDAEVRALLTATGRAPERDMRDHILLLLTLKTGVRVAEATGLNVGDVRGGKGVRTIVPLRPETTKGNKPRDIIIPESTRRKVAAYLSWKEKRGEPLDDAAPLFVSRGGGRGGRKGGGRLSIRSAEHLFTRWQKAAGFERHVHFHVLRHTFASATLRKTKNLRLVQDMLGHSSPTTTAIYTHPTTEEKIEAAESLDW